MIAPIYAIGDIHGQLGQLEIALSRIEKDGGDNAQIVFLGDYIDRGAQSREVIDLLIEGLANGRNWVCLLGNHDRMFSMFMEEYPRHDSQFLIGYHWLHQRIGGIETLRSYGVEVTEGDRLFQVHKRARAAIPSNHIEFLRNRPYFHQVGELLFVHAGIRPGLGMESQSKDDLIWIRGEFLNDSRTHPWLVVHGHTPAQTAEHKGNRVNLDSGAGEGRDITAAVFEGRTCWKLTDQGRAPLKPAILPEQTT
ncbi:metallophosphoesterase family protein [Ruegeria sp. SCP11]|uniref:metallophosphoesterase family protein n=1 Tax=Ruegeria sp. SCP11 TaxID=3141378 RepID=UPI003334B3B2